MTKRARKNRSPLRARIEKVIPEEVIDQPVDSVDEDLGSYIEAFLQGLPNAVQLEKFSIATPEEAKQALVVIDDTLNRLNQQIKNARMLQQLVNSRRA